MKKLHLLEDADENIVSEQQDVFQTSNLLTSMIKSEWDCVDLFSSILISIEDQHKNLVSDIIENIISDHYIHIGQLEKALQLVNTNADGIEDGKEDAEDIILDQE